MSLNLSVFDTVTQSTEGAWLHLTVPGSRDFAYLDGHLDKPKKPLRIQLKGADSDTFAKELQRINKKSRKTGNKEKNLEEIAREWSELYAKMTISWENMPSEDGKPLECNFENALKVYLNYKDIRVQVGDFIANQENFIKTSATG